MTVSAFPGRPPQAVAADPAVNVFVMANAGSGKTTTLVSRVARLLLAGAQPHAVLCLTFTKAAAAEMQRRLYQLLGRWAVTADDVLAAELARLEGRDAAAYDGAALSRARALFARALETPGGLKIQTIHAFCEQLLRRFPLEAGVSPLFRVIDEVEAAAVRAAAREAVARASVAGADPALADAYAAMAGRLDHKAFEQMFARFEEKRAALAEYVGDLDAEGIRLKAALAAGLDAPVDADAVERAAVTPPALDPEAWLAAAAALARGNEKTDQPRGAQLQATAEAVRRGEAPVEAARAIFFTDGGPRKTLATRAVDAATCDWLAREQDRLVEADRVARRARVSADTAHALILAAAYAGEYEAAKAARGALDFGDLIARALWLLRDGPGARWVLYKLDGGVDHILVDEAQDTSPEQWAIVRALTDEFFSGANAREAGLNRTVFVVGDEKQSIFSFQGAAPERLEQESRAYAAKVHAVGGEFRAVELTQSWRSTAEVLGFVDAVFADPALAGALSPGRDAGDDRGLVVRHDAARRDRQPGCIDVWAPLQDVKSEERRAWDEPLDVDLARGARRQAAERVAAEIKAIVEGGEAVHADDRGDPARWRPAGWGDVLVLVKQRGPMFEAVLRALKQAGAPVAGADRLKLSEHPVFQDLLSLVRAALYRGDDLSLAEVLRSPLCDVSEARLFELAHPREGGLWRALRDSPDEACADAVALIEAVRAAAQEQAPFDLFAGLVERQDRRGLSIRQRFLTRLGGEAADALDAFLEQARAAEGRGATDLQSLLAALSALEQTVKREMDEPRGEVRVMTAHSAKGLEAPIVILPDTIFEDPRGDALLETDDGGFLWCASSSGDCDASAEARAARKRKNEEESLRLLYVGLTRARDRLILGGRLRGDRKLDNVGAWWRPIAAALERLGGEVRTTTAASGHEIRRYGPDPRRMPPQGAAAAAAVAAPGWLSAPPTAEAASVSAAPSRLQAGLRFAVPSPLERAAGGLGRFRRGDLIHRLLERLPDLPPEARAAAAGAMLAREPDLTDEQRDEMAAAALRVLDDPRFAAVFGPGSRAEAALTGTAPELPHGMVASARLDRLVVTPDRVLVVDFKTNRPPPERIEDADPAYVLQMAVYRAVLGALYPGRAVEAALLWTDGPTLMPVPETMMAAALAAR